MRVFIREGLYSPEEIADLLVLSTGGSRFQARKILVSRRQSVRKMADDDMLYLAAYRLFNGKRSPYTAIMKVAGKRGRTLWNRLNKSGQSLEELAQSIIEKYGVKFDC